MQRTIPLAIAALMAIAPVHAGGVGRMDRAPNSGVFVQDDACNHTQALSTLNSQGMSLVSEVPRTPAAWRFIVNYKQQLFGASVYAANCKVELIRHIDQIRPWCEYLPGIRQQCPLGLAQ